ncbi:hypothetical protein PEB0122_021870 [Bartonella apis]|uniref:Uncharacterized protein n=1 Tax=Bartonella apis TaxID=1686310 RepID=A0A1R0F6Q6_9HYPH|nr:hypothetical protein PEB0149_000530 [Bartonella apis]OLY47343.1 hypothetical protein PEB0122_021870 [Bartonella apis]
MMKAQQADPALLKPTQIVRVVSGSKICPCQRENVKEFIGSVSGL